MTREQDDLDVSNAIRRVTELLAQCEAYLQVGNPPPDWTLLQCKSPFGAIVDAKFNTDEHGPRMAVVVRDTEDRSSRLFDPWYHLVLILLDLAGVPLVWHKKTQKGEPYFRLMLQMPPGHEATDGIPAARLIADTPAGVETRFLRGHYDLRRAALTMRSAAKRPHPPKYVRSDIIAAANAEFRSLLERALAVADRLHDKQHPDEEAE